MNIVWRPIDISLPGQRYIIKEAMMRKETEEDPQRSKLLLGQRFKTKSYILGRRFELLDLEE